MWLGPLALAASVLLTLGDPQARLVEPSDVVFPFHDETLLWPNEHDGGKLWRSRGLPTDGTAVPLVIFIHGITWDRRMHHWLSVDPRSPLGDARPLLASLVASGDVPPLVVAAPSQTRDGDDPTKIFVGLDFDDFVDAVDAALTPAQHVDRSRVVVVGHSAGSCYPHTAAYAALDAKRFRLRALFAIDGCLSHESGVTLASTHAADAIIATYETWAWERDFDGFVAGWQQGGGTRNDGTMHVMESMDFESDDLHMAVLHETLKKWLPIVLPNPERSPVGPAAPSLPFAF
jgi:hypothetical protein